MTKNRSLATGNWQLATRCPRRAPQAVPLNVKSRVITTRCWRLSLLAACCLLFCSWAIPALASDEIPGALPKRPIALVGGTVYTMTGQPLSDATVVIDDGKIVAVGTDVNVPDDAKRIDVRGKHVYPGLICSNGSMGLLEIDAVRATIDVAESGRINPNVRAQVAVNPDSELIPVARSNGVLLSLTIPQGGLISGTAALIQHDGWTWEDMTVRAPIAMHVDWPYMQPVLNWHTEQSGKEQLRSRDRALGDLQKLFDDARAYKKARQAASEAAKQPGKHAAQKHQPQPLDVRLEAMQPVLDGRLPLLVSADRADQIQAAVAFAAQEDVRLIILGGYDAGRCAALLKKHKVPVIVGGTMRVPQRRDEPYDEAYTLPERLRKAGVQFCIGSGGRFADANMRNLPYNAAMAVGFGLSKDEAIRAITLYPAQILGVDDRLGSLEKGKDATLFVADGDILEAPTHVEAAYIQGRPVDLSDRHKRLWHKYQQKYQRLKGSK